MEEKKINREFPIRIKTIKQNQYNLKEPSDKNSKDKEI